MRRIGMALLSCVLAGCFASRTAPTDASAPDGDGGPIELPPPPTGEVDLLLVVDNSGSMTEEQASLGAELPRMIRALGTGDLDGDGVAESTPVASLQVGVVTTDMGTGGFTVPTCARSTFGDDGLLRTSGNTAIVGCDATYPPFLTFDPATGDPDAFARAVSCVLTNTGGCGFEQQLEAALKALDPGGRVRGTPDHYVAPRFFRNTIGHGASRNDGFVRADSLLAVVIVSDEEDCSAFDTELFNPSSATYGSTDLNLRCFAHADQALYPTTRYVEGLLQLRRHPSRLLYAVLAGVPVDLAPPPGEPVEWDRLVGPPGVRDPRMEEGVDPAMPNRLIPSCNVPGRGVAFPPVRMVRVARELEARGARVVVGSICQDRFGGVVDGIVRGLRD